jgi:hypothetical protein
LPKQLKDTPMAITGRCFCGAVTFTCDEPPVMTRTCWCRDCRYLASGNATVNAVFKAEGVKVTGQVSEYRSTADSGNVMRRSGRHAEFGTASRFKPAGKHAAIRHPVTLVSGSGSRWDPAPLPKGFGHSPQLGLC